VGRAEEHNADLVERGLLTEDQAAARNTRPRKRAGALVDLPFPYGMQGEALETAAEAIDISVEELIAQLQEGKSIADVAEAKGTTAEAVVDALVAAREDANEELISLDLMTETQSRLALDRYRAAAERLVEKAHNGEGPVPGRRPIRGFAGTFGHEPGARGRKFMVIWR